MAEKTPPEAEPVQAAPPAPSASGTSEPMVQPPASATTARKGGGMMRNSAVFSGLTLVSRLVGFARDTVITAVLGASVGPAADGRARPGCPRAAASSAFSRRAIRRGSAWP